ncbi:MAG: Anaerobic sulfite reductase subunit, partial [Gammaproteobacteria bacterium]|nr:Anaerobic sulfite reductase subunit [Gammaproteobacteria bacterium]
MSVIDTPVNTKIVARSEESSDIFTLTLQFTDNPQSDYVFQPGQFNMLYLFGVGEVPISILSHGEG